MSEAKLFPAIASAISNLPIEDLSPNRKAVLQPLIDYIQDQAHQNNCIRLNLICTHNSRRSHLAQIWAQTAAAYYGISNVDCYSGGTDATAVFPEVIKTLEVSGFRIQVIAEGKNPIYAVKYAENEPAVIAFSKTYFDAFNPQSKFAAVLTCSEADGGCPFISGAQTRIAIAYDDPKVYDHSAQQSQKYQERSLQIATEMAYVFSKIKSQ